MSRMIGIRPAGYMGRTAHLRAPALGPLSHMKHIPDREPALRLGRAEPADELRDAASARGIDVHLLERGRRSRRSSARAADADVLGMAGGDGSLAAVAEVAIERDLPFVCIPFGTRNHFARDIGLDRDDPIGALAAFDGRRAANRRRPGRRAALPEQRLARALRPARPPARAAPPAAATRSPGFARSLLVAREHRGKDPFVIDGEPRGRAGRRRRRQRLQLRAALDRRAGIDGRRACSTSTCRTGSAASRGTSGAAPSSRSRRPSSVGARGDRRRAGAARVAGRAPDRAAGATRAGAAFARVRGSRRRSRRRARPAQAARPARTSEARRGRRPAAPFLLPPRRSR